MLIPEKSDALVNSQMAMPMEIRFDINAFRKRCLLAGIDLIDYLVLLKPEIEQFEHKLATWEE
jgi:3-isopropylmalate dehydratase small subunit